MLGKPAFGLDSGYEGRCDLPSSPVFVEAKLSVSRTNRLAGLVDAGFHLVAVNVQLSRPSAAVPGSPKAAVRPARAEDRNAVGEIAETVFTYDRFHADTAIAPSTADRLKREWACNFFSGERGDEMAVGEVDGKVVGFNLLIRTDDKLIIDLIAVAPGVRRRGLANAMIAFAIERWGRGAETFVGTQLANAASIRLYESLGFAFASAAFMLHHHGIAGP